MAVDRDGTRNKRAAMVPAKMPATTPRIRIELLLTAIPLIDFYVSQSSDELASCAKRFRPTSPLR